VARGAVARATRAATRVAQASRLPPVVHAEEPSGQDVSTPSIQPSNPAATLEAARGLGCAGQTTAPTPPHGRIHRGECAIRHPRQDPPRTATMAASNGCRWFLVLHCSSSPTSTFLSVGTLYSHLPLPSLQIRPNSSSSALWIVTVQFVELQVWILKFHYLFIV
jgi:hypothetical protein